VADNGLNRKLFFQLAHSHGTWLQFRYVVQKSGSRKWPWHSRTYICEQDKTDYAYRKSPLTA